MKPIVLLLKSHVATYTKKDGTLVTAHDDKRKPMTAAEHHDTAEYHRGVAINLRNQRKSRAGTHTVSKEDPDAHLDAAKLHDLAKHAVAGGKGGADASEKAEAATRALGHEPLRGLK